MHINTQIEAMPGNNPEYLAAILDSLSDGIIACDKNGMLTIFNHSSHKFDKFPEQPISPEQWADQYNLYEKDGITPMMMEHIPPSTVIAVFTTNGDTGLIVSPGTGGMRRSATTVTRLLRRRRR